MNSMTDFAEEVTMVDFLVDIVDKHNKNFPEAAISSETFTVGASVFKHIMKEHSKLMETGDEDHAGAYIASCLAIYIMLFNQVSSDTVTITPGD